MPAMPQPLRRRLLTPAAGFYLAWACLALLSHLAGSTTMTPAAAGLLIAAVLVTNILLVMLDLPGSGKEAKQGVAAAETGLAIAWITVYAVLANGPGELVPAMYLTAVLMALTRTDARRLRELSLAAAGAYALCVVIRLLAGGSATAPWSDLLQCAGVIAMLIVLAHRAQRIEREEHSLQEQILRQQDEIERLNHSAERDHLTKSFNRRYIMDALVREKARADRSGRTFSICLFDLDRFKSLNDAHGHLVGDQVLTTFAERTRRALRAMDAVNPTRFRRALGRLGGEEFLAILPDTDIGGAMCCAERVRESLAGEPVGDDLVVTVSAGVAQYRPGETIPELLTRADQAMYAAKRNGRNRVHISTAHKLRPDPQPSRPSLRLVR